MDFELPDCAPLCASDDPAFREQISALKFITEAINSQEEVEKE